MAGLATAATAVTSIEALGGGDLLPATRGQLQKLADSSKAQHMETKFRLIELYRDKLFEVELREEANPDKTLATRRVYDARKRSLKNAIKALEKATQ